MFILKTGITWGIIKIYCDEHESEYHKKQCLHSLRDTWWRSLLAYHKCLTTANIKGPPHMLMPFLQQAYTTQACLYSMWDVKRKEEQLFDCQLWRNGLWLFPEKRNPKEKEIVEKTEHVLLFISIDCLYGRNHRERWFIKTKKNKTMWQSITEADQ